MVEEMKRGTTSDEAATEQAVATVEMPQPGQVATGEPVVMASHPDLAEHWGPRGLFTVDVLGPVDSLVTQAGALVERALTGRRPLGPMAAAVPVERTALGLIFLLSPDGAY